MKPEAVKQMKRFFDARDLLHDAVDQYETTIGALKGALSYAESAMSECSECSDPEAVQQIASMRDLVGSLPRAAFEVFGAIAETMEALANEMEHAA